MPCTLKQAANVQEVSLLPCGRVASRQAKLGVISGSGANLGGGGGAFKGAGSNDDRDVGSFDAVGAGLDGWV